MDMQYIYLVFRFVLIVPQNDLVLNWIELPYLMCIVLYYCVFPVIYNAI